MVERILFAPGGASEATLTQVRDYLDTVEAKIQSIRDRLDLQLDVDVETGLAKELTLGQVLTKLGDIFNAVDGLEVTAGNIEINSDTLNLQTDEIEALLRAVRDRLPLLLDDDGGLKAHIQNQLAQGLTDTQLRATPIATSGPANRFGGNKTPVVATVVNSGDNFIHTPAGGKRVKLYWVSAINDPDEATTPLIRVLIGGLECYRAYAVAHWEEFVGAVDAPLNINLSSSASVAVTAHIEEV